MREVITIFFILLLFSMIVAGCAKVSNDIEAKGGTNGIDTHRIGEEQNTSTIADAIDNLFEDSKDVSPPSME